MKLYLVQHGEAELTEKSSERELTDQGQLDVTNIAEFLGRTGVRVDRIIHSGKLRAQQTASILASAVGEDAPVETTPMINPNDDPKPFALEISELTSDTMIVGHMPFMARLVSYLISGDTNRIITLYHPGSVVCLERDTGGPWTIAWMLRPELFE